MSEETRVVVSRAEVSADGNAWLDLCFLRDGVLELWDTMLVTPKIVEGFQKALDAAARRDG